MSFSDILAVIMIIVIIGLIGAFVAAVWLLIKFLALRNGLIVPVPTPGILEGVLCLMYL
jgi:hypothetical protein